MKSPDQSLLVLSPHLDDAVLSVGALMAGFHSVTVVTVFSGGPEGQLSQAAIEEDRGRYGGDPLPLRLEEDRRAAEVLGFERVLLDLPEVLFRRRPQGQFRCESLDEIFGELIADDDIVISDVASAVQQSTRGREFDVVMTPLGLGNHIDHLVVRAAAERLETALTYYLDMPYAVRGFAVSDPMRTKRAPWSQYQLDVDAWLRAIACYGSQVPVLFENIDWRAVLHKWAVSDAAFVLNPR